MMKRLLLGLVLMMTALVGVTSSTGTVSAEHAESPAGDARDISLRLGNGGSNACIILDNGNVRCWGNVAGTGVPGSGNIGDDETPDQVRPVDLGERTVVETDGGVGFSCVLLDDGAVRCWGYQSSGPVLGVPSSGGQRIGDDEEPTTIPPVDLGGRATAIAAGSGHACALLEDGTVRCWGKANSGQLGYGNTEEIGDGGVGTPESPLSGGPVDVGAGRTVLTASAGATTTCVILDNLTVRCWGDGPIVGQGFDITVGDDEVPADVPVINYNGTPVPPPSTRVPAGGTLRVNVPALNGEGGTVVGNLAGVNPAGAGFVTAYACDDGPPRDAQGNFARSDLNYRAAQTVSNRLIVNADTDGDICFYTSAATDLVIDINGVAPGITSTTNQRTDTRNT